MAMLDPKDPSEEYAISFDFSAVLTSITTATVIVDFTAGGSVSNPTAILNGARQISGGTVLQRVTGGTPDRSYGLRCEASNGVEKYVLTATLPVKTKKG